ncbi:MAG: TetR family transcriptional regulator [Alphaproteobacteria bacterium]|nr:TetR family transcriptional regulator [Alphaproteobacteria bacterium]MDE2011874.1 TetR family transcriptional regulator [Alphaproteobacteria bacterium]MDE2073674.1 TetR family transcriptional regulator [Alphaproteobacteria bacterium]MDE2352922.1 TetR family transcriptional regulator [Alphaproteobacteria bacterium]
MSAAGKTTAEHRAERRARERKLTREAILEAARRVAAREGANLSLRAVAAEAGFAPAALYGYFANKSELLIALAAEDLSDLARVLRAARGENGASRLGAAAEAALALLQNSDTFATAPGALPAEVGSSEAERLFNGRLIAVLRALSDASGHPADSRAAQADIVLLAATLAGLAVFARSGRLAALGFSPADMIAALDRRFLPAP